MGPYACACWQELSPDPIQTRLALPSYHVVSANVTPYVATVGSNPNAGPNPPGQEYRFWCHTHAVRTIASSSVYFGFQPNSSTAFSELATSTAGSPGRLGCSSAGIGWPVTRRTDSITSCTLKPFP